MEPGVYPGVSRADYDALDAANHSRLKLLRRSPLHCHTGGGPGESDATQLGTLVHAYLLEPERFRASHVVIPDLTVGILDDKGRVYTKPKATAQYKQRLAEFGRQHAGQTFLDRDQLDVCERIGEAIATSATATALLTEPADVEALVVWRDPDTGVWCKGLLDHLARDRDCVVDLKTTTDASPAAFARDAFKYGYHTQAAYYLWGLACVGQRVGGFTHVVVETEPPHGVAVYELDDQALDLGLRTVQGWLREYAECVRLGRWGGYPDQVQTLGLPRWAFTSENQT